MRMRSIAGSAAILALVVAFGVLAGIVARDNSPGAAAQTDESGRRTVSVSGNGEMSVAPDLGFFIAGVEISNEDPNVALEESNAAVEAVTAALIGAGVSEDDVTLGSFSIWPEYDYRDESPVLRGYRVSHQLSVKVRDIDQTGTLLGVAVDAGANMIHNVGFTVDDPASALDQAREAAFENARHKAENLAALANGSLGEIVSITENTYTPYPVGRDGADAEEGAGSSVPINPGDTTYSVDLQIVWELN